MPFYKERGYEHGYQLGHIVLCQYGAALIVGVRVKHLRTETATMRSVIYTVLPDNSKRERRIFEHDIIGYCSKVERGKRQIETIPGL